MAKAKLVMATLTGCADKSLLEERFDVVVIDEAGQALEAACWIAMLKADRVILAGDPMQLPPTVTSKEAAQGGLAVTLLERVVNHFGDDVTRLLCVQYRMHEKIMRFSSRELYKDRLVADDSVKAHLLKDLPGVECFDGEDDEDEDEITCHPLIFIDTVGCGMEESQEEEGSSHKNDGEAGVVAEHVRALIAKGVSQNKIAVITPYNAQVGCISALLAGQFPQLEIGSVDGFQGREKEAVVISLVRSNKKGVVGFLADVRRINVAITRARRHLCICGDSATVSRDPFLKRFVAYLEDEADCRPLSVVSGGGNRRNAGKQQAGNDNNNNNNNNSNNNDGRSGVVVLGPKGPAGQNSAAKFEERVMEVLMRFRSTPKDRLLLLDPALNAAQRRTAHEMATSFGLYHRSKGEGKDRTLHISKDPFPTAEREEVSIERIPVVSAESKEDVHEEPEHADEETASTAVAATSEPLPAPSSASPGPPPSSSPSSSSSSSGLVAKKPKKKSSTASSAPPKKNPSSPSGESLIEKNKDPSLCQYVGCRTIASLVMAYTTCRHCSRAFCTTHALAEVHGCGKAAAKAAKEAFAMKHAVATGTKKAPATAKEVDQMRSALQKKIKSAAESRAPKKKDDKKKKK